MHRAAEACSQFLADNLTLQNCLSELRYHHMQNVLYICAWLLGILPPVKPSATALSVSQSVFSSCLYICL